jgi:hypothetical protein
MRGLKVSIFIKASSDKGCVHCKSEGKKETPRKCRSFLSYLVYAALSYLKLLLVCALSYVMLLVNAALSYCKGCVHCKSEGKNGSSRNGRS